VQKTDPRRARRDVRGVRGWVGDGDQLLGRSGKEKRSASSPYARPALCSEIPVVFDNDEAVAVEQARLDTEHAAHSASTRFSSPRSRASGAATTSRSMHTEMDKRAAVRFLGRSRSA
jgi:hypothetical protein